MRTARPRCLTAKSVLVGRTITDRVEVGIAVSGVKAVTVTPDSRPLEARGVEKSQRRFRAIAASRRPRQ